jgi:simple sugar transport system substrate-binding protein|tara:strand:+ start:1090 stop:2085 length:996 start_codon:yes stop_codon:yes gene_type:complete
MKVLKLILSLVFIIPFSMNSFAGPTGQDLGEKWCKDVKMHFYAGGPEAGGFAGIVAAGAMNAIRDTGADAEILYSEWDFEKMVRQLRESIGLGVDAIAMMGHPGDEALMPLAKQASEKGILMTYQNVDPGGVRAKFGGGYVGANLATQGKALAREAIRQFGLKAGDHAIVMVPIGDYARAQREDGARIIFEEHGMTVTVLDGQPAFASDPNLVIPIFGAALNANPETKIIVHSGSDVMNVAEGIAKAAGYGPNEILQVGFDTSPQIMTALEKGYVHLTSDQQPFLQGYLPVLSLCQTAVLGTGAINQDTGAGFVDTNNYKAVKALADAGLR